MLTVPVLRASLQVPPDKACRSPMIVFSKLVVLLHHPQALPDGPRRSFTRRRPLGGCSGAPTPPDNGASEGQLGRFQPTRSTSSGLPAAPPTPEVSLTALPSTAHRTAREHGQPSKYNRPNGKGPDRGKGHSARPAKLQPFPAGTSGSQPSSKPASVALVGKAAQLVLRHEDFLTGLAQSTSWVMFEGTAPPLSTIAAQAKVAEQWRNMKEESRSPSSFLCEQSSFRRGRPSSRPG